jgi:ABC-type multidrug transport system ATPase subunit
MKSSTVEIVTEKPETPTAPSKQTTPVQLVFENVCVDVPTRDKVAPTKRILNEVTGTFGPRDLTAVMGPSGSGKTTMLYALTGVATPTSGSIRANGQLYDERSMKTITAFVPQDDLMLGVFTAKEALLEAAALKTTFNLQERHARAMELLKTFNLLECKDVAIGHPEGSKGLSGGQRKRLSVALELMGSPSLLFLDEPTSGLDSVSAHSLVRIAHCTHGTNALRIARRCSR